MAVFGPVGPGQRKVGFAVLAGDDVPVSQPATVGQDPACLRVQPGFVGHVHLNVLADGDVESAVGERKFGDVGLTDGDPAVEPDESDVARPTRTAPEVASS